MIRKVLAKIARGIPLYRELLQVRDAINRVERLHVRRASLEAQRHFEDECSRNARYREPGRLLRYAAQINSQGGEDGILHEIFRRIGAASRVFLEIGVGDGTENNTAFLLSQGWNGFWIDGDPTFVAAVERRHDLAGGALRWSVSFEDAASVAARLERLGVPGEFDLLSLDIDQNTYYLWEALHEYSPRVVVVEYNAAIPADIDWKVRYEPGRAWDGSRNFGASLKALEGLGSRLGYCLVGCDFGGANAFFVRKDLVGEHFAAPFTSENHYEPPRYEYLLPRQHPKSILDRIHLAR